MFEKFQLLYFHGFDSAEIGQACASASSSFAQPLSLMNSVCSSSGLEIAAGYFAAEDFVARRREECLQRFFRVRIVEIGRFFAGVFPAPGEVVHPDRRGQGAAAVAAQTDASGKSGHHDHFLVTGAHFFYDFGGAAERRPRECRFLHAPIPPRPLGSLPGPISPPGQTGEHLAAEHVFHYAEGFLPSQPVISRQSAVPVLCRNDSIDSLRRGHGHGDGAVAVGVAAPGFGSRGQDAPQSIPHCSPVHDAAGQQVGGTLLIFLGRPNSRSSR